MASNRYEEMAIKYHVEDLAGALIPGGRLSKILDYIELRDETISNISQEFLLSKGLLALLDYAKKDISFSSFVGIALPEQAERILAASIKALGEQAEQKIKDNKQKLKDEAVQAKLREIRKRKEKRKEANKPDLDLREKYNLSHYIEKAQFLKLMNILRRVNTGVRLSEEEVVWLSTEGNDYFTQELKTGFHKIEADYHAAKYKKNKDPWSAINASSHYRKSNGAKTADGLLSTIDMSVLKEFKLKSALCTTHGGVKRDLKEWQEALRLGDEAHLLNPQDFRPCTLLGAVNMEIGHYSIGYTWYEKAIRKGFKEKSMDNELKSIFMCADKLKQDDLRSCLLKIDPVRYSWTTQKCRK